MPETSLSSLPTECWGRLHSLLDEFEGLLLAGMCPDVNAFLAREPVHRNLLLCECLLIEIEIRSKRGEQVELRSYLRRFPEIEQDPNLAARFFTVDYRRQRERDPGLTRHEHLRRTVNALPQVDPGATTLLGLDSSHNPTRRTGQVSSMPQLRDGNSMRFIVLRDHAVGGLGKVSIAHDADLNREVALKAIRPDRDDHWARARFLTEAEITGQLEHPGVVPIYAAGKDAAGRPYYAMRFIEGESLRDAITAFHAMRVPQFRSGLGHSRRGRAQTVDFTSLAFRQLLQRFTVVCNTLAFAHSKGIIHRDLKPANIMLGEFGETLVVDWGLAKRLQGDSPAKESKADVPGAEDTAGLTNVGDILGTPAYMAPEQAAGRTKELGPATDVYSLGAILYELLTNRPPHSGNTVTELLKNVSERLPDAPRDLVPHLPRPLEAICLKAMQRAPADRYSTASELAQDVERWLADEPVAAHVEPWLARSGRWMRKHRLLVRTLLATCAIALPSLTIALLAVNHYRENEKDAKETALGARDRARETIETMLSEESIEVLSRQKELTPLQKQFLRNVVKYYEELAQEIPDDETGRGKRARAFALMGQAQMLLGERPSAESSLRKATSLAQALAAEHPEDVKYQRMLASIYNHHYLTLVALGRFAEAEVALRACIRIDEELARAEPDEPDLRQALAVAYSNLGLLLREVGRIDEAQLALQNSRTIGEKLVREFPKHPGYRQKLGRSILNLGFVCESVHRFDEAASNYQEGSSHLKALAEEHPGNAEYEEEYAKSLNNVGVGFHNVGKYRDARDWYFQAVAAYKKLTTEYPVRTDYRRVLANAHKNLAYVLAQLGEYTRAEAESKAAVAILDKLCREAPEEPLNGLYFARTLSQLGGLLDKLKRHTEAEAAHRQAVAIAAKLPQLPTYQVVHAEAYERLINHLLVLKRFDELHAMREEAARVFGARVQQEPKNTLLRHDLASFHNSLGVALGDQGKHELALVELDCALKLLDRLVREEPKVYGHLVLLGYAQTNRSRSLGALGRYAESLEAITQAGLAQMKAIQLGADFGKGIPIQPLPWFRSQESAKPDRAP